MRLVLSGILLGGLAGATTAVTAQSSGQSSGQSVAVPLPAPPPPIGYPPPPAPPRSGKEKPAIAMGNPSLWVIPDDYPSESLRNNEQGTTAFRVTVGPDGRPSACHVISSSGSARLDETSCSLLLRRARFTPALDRKGKPTEGSWVSRFRWVLPEPQIQPSPQPFLDQISFIVEPDGSATECTATGDTTKLTREKGPCGYGKVFEPYKDAAGNPVRRKVVLTISTVVTDPAAPPSVIAPSAPKSVNPVQRRKRP